MSAAALAAGYLMSLIGPSTLFPEPCERTPQ
jgi:hypothetical protein